MSKIAIFGAAGAIGPSVGAELEARGLPFRVVGRNRARLEAVFGGMRQAEIHPADLADEGAAAAAASDAGTIVYCVGVPYDQFRMHPRLMDTAVRAAVRAGVERMVAVSSVYSYGVPRTRRVAETHPREPLSVKGRYRKEQEDILLAAHAKGLLRGMVLRLPDFYGPHAENSLAGEIFRAARAGKRANWLGPASTAHEFVYVPDTGPVIADLAARPEAYGEAWNYGGPGEINAAEFIQKVYLAAGREPRFRSVGRTMLRLAGIFSPFLRELPEMLYLSETPVILDDRKLLAALPGVRKTSYDDGIRGTLAWMRARGV